MTITTENLETLSVAEIADLIKHTAPNQELRVHKVGEAGRQGDIYVFPINGRPPAWSVQVSLHTQVALGDNIGSRHIATGRVRVYWPESKVEALKQMPINRKGDKLKNKRAKAWCDGINDLTRQNLIGPVVESDEPWVLTHPEHAHHRFPAGIYLVTYQLDWRTHRAVRD